MATVALWGVALSTGCARSGFDEILLEEGDPVPWHDVGGGPAASGETSLGYVVWAQEPLALAIDQRGNAVVAYSNSATVEARRWSGSVWEDLGSPGEGNMVTLTLDAQDRAWVAWNATGSPASVRIAMHGGGAWQELPSIEYSAPLPAAGFAYPTLGFDSDDRAIVAAGTGGGGGDSVCVHRMEGGEWLLVATPTGPCFNSDDQRPGIAAGANGSLLLTHAGRRVSYFEWAAGAWTRWPMVDDSPDWQDEWPAVSTSGPVVAWVTAESLPYGVYLRRWNGSTWAELAGSATGMGLGRAVSGVSSVALVANPHDHPVVAWSDGTTLYARYWTGSAWAQVFESFTTGIYTGQVGTRPAIAVHNREICVAFTAGSETEFDVYVRCATPDW